MSSLAGLEESYRWCEKVARTQAANFYHAFRLLPRSQHRAMCALYAFMRVTDDLADEPGRLDARRQDLQRWREQVELARRGNPTHPVLAAFTDMVAKCRIPEQYIQDVIDGVEMDLYQDRYATFADLRRYCYRVASAVGLCCVHIWGFTGGDEALAAAESAGIALQLTNILRDLAEDGQRGRLYLPREELERFGVREEDVFAGRRSPQLHELLAFQAERAHEFYDAARPLERMLEPPGRAVFFVMTRTYRALLDRIIARDYDVFSERLRVPRWYKLWLVLRALPIRWGLA